MYHQLYFLPPLSCFHAHLLALSHIYIHDLVNKLDCSSTQTLPLQATGFQTSRPWTHTKLQAFRPAGPEHTPSYRLSDQQALNTRQATGFQTSRPWTRTKLQTFRLAGPEHAPSYRLSDQQAPNTHLWTVLPQTPPVQTTHSTFWPCFVCTKQKTPKRMPVKETIYTSNAMQFGQGAPENCK